MRLFFFVLTTLLIISCQNITKANKSGEVELKDEIVGFDEPLKVDLNDIIEELCSGNVLREFERLNNRYIEFEADIKNINRTHLLLFILESSKRRYKSDLGQIKAIGDREVVLTLDKSKTYRFRGVFKFNSLEENYCSDYEPCMGCSPFYRNESIQIVDIIAVEEITDREYK